MMSSKTRRILLLPGLLAVLLCITLTGNQPVYAQGGLPTYLIIAPDAFVDTLAPLITLQQERGFDVQLANLSETGAAKEQIKAYIQGLNPRPKYVLLVGDTSLIPAWDADRALEGSAVTDYDYAELGGDYRPDVILGRLPVHDGDQLTAYISKLAAFYQRSTDPAWLNQVSFVSTDTPGLQAEVETAYGKIIDQFTKPYGYTGTFPDLNTAKGGDRFYPGTYAASAEDALKAVNDGRAVVTFVGLGTSARWEWQAGEWLTSTDIHALTGPPIPLVIGLTHGTPDLFISESLPEAWLNHPTAGALTTIFSVGGPANKENVFLAEEFFRVDYSPWSTVPSVGETYLKALDLLAVSTGTSTYYELYQLYGDPSLTLRQPRGLRLTVPVSNFIVPYGYWVTLPISIQNVGPTTETFTLNNEADIPYPGGLSQTEITLNSGQSTNIFLTILHTLDFPEKKHCGFTITAVQKSIPEIFTQIQFTTQTFKPSVFFPVIHR